MSRKDEILRLQHDLSKRRDALRRVLVSDINLLKELHLTSGDLDEISSRLVEIESLELDKIEIALGMMRSDTYGLCSNCGCDIPIVRLQALPYAIRCMSCQRLAEKGENLEENHEST